MSILLLIIVLIVNEISIFAKIHNSFLPKAYKVQGKSTKFDVRQVPGDGGCLFWGWGQGACTSQTKQHSDLTSRLVVSQQGLHVNACLQTGLSHIG